MLICSLNLTNVCYKFVSKNKAYDGKFKNLILKSVIKQKRFEILPNFCCCCELQLRRVEKERYFIHMPSAAGLTVLYPIKPNLRAHFGVYGFVSEQLHHECWP